MSRSSEEGRRFRGAVTEAKSPATRREREVDGMTTFRFLKIPFSLFVLFALVFCFAEARAARTEGESQAAKKCVQCHAEASPGIVNDWEKSHHARAGISCIDCHQADPTDADAWQHEGAHIATIVSPRDCSKCHPKPVKEFFDSKHAGAASFLKAETGERDKDNVLAYTIEGDAAAAVGCERCHGNIIKVKNGKLDPGTWPNGGIGRVNPDGSKGSCTACHTRHLFSVAESRKPETCGTCHMGPDHPHLEIYLESKHGVIYANEKDHWNFDVPGNAWGVKHFRAPTCATCHMSGIGKLESTHDVGKRLSWDLRSPLSQKTANWPVKRNEMKKVCLSCHSNEWVEGYYLQFDNAIVLYNEGYYKPVKEKLDELYALGLLSKPSFDEEIEFAWYEFWHHEGRRARMGAAMMGPDFAQWHGFYELAKHRLKLLKAIEKIKNSKGVP
jgi:hypothetical protein